MTIVDKDYNKKGANWFFLGLVRVSDHISVLLAGWIAYYFRFHSWIILHERYTWALLVGFLLQSAVFPALGLYKGWRTRWFVVSSSRVVVAYVVWLLSAVLILFIFHLQQYSRVWLLSWMMLSIVGSIAIRGLVSIVVTRSGKKDSLKRSVLLIGDAESCKTAYNALIHDRYGEYRITRVLIMDYPLESRLQRFDFISKFNLGDPVEVMEQEVWVCLPLQRGADADAIIRSLGTVVANVRLMPNLSELNLVNHSMSMISGLNVINVSCSTMRPSDQFKKRMLDITFSSLVLLLGSPVYIILALSVKLTSRGPVFFRQKRMGWNGKSFNMLKFRSMSDTPDVNAQSWGHAHDKQVTSVGAFLRRKSLDELPQFINVLIGDMSIVGPRPEQTEFVRQFKEEIPGYMQKHLVKAGITGWAQVNGWRGDTSLEKRIENDLWYIENWSIWLDIKIIMLTAIKVLFDKSAY